MKAAHPNAPLLHEGERRNSTSSSQRSEITPPPVSQTGMSSYEKKCLLINEEIDSHGMGRYQWYIWILCGFGYLIDLLWAQAFGLVLGPVKQELGFADNESGNISIAFSAGLTAGAFTWGALVDVIGRKWAFNLTVLFSGVFGLGLGGCTSYTSFLVVTAFIGFGIGGNIPIDTTICLEFIPQNKRFLLALLSIFQPIGVVLTSAIAYGFIPNYSCEPNFSEPDALPSCRNVAAGTRCCSKQDNMGWRYLMFTLGAITLTIFVLRFLVFNFQESPKYLLYRGHNASAVSVLENIATTNGKSCGISLSDFDKLDEEESMAERMAGTTKVPSWRVTLAAEKSRFGSLFSSWQMSRLTILVWLTYICDASGFTLAGTYLPLILANKNAKIDLSLEFTYRSYMAIYTPGIVGVAIGSLMYSFPHIGRKLTMMISSALMGVSIFLFSAANSQASNIGLNTMEYFFQSMFNAVLYGWTPEVFPAPIRGTACGIASFWGRLFSILSPLIAQNILGENGLQNEEAVKKILYFAGGITLGCVVTTGLLPNKMLGKQSL